MKGILLSFDLNTFEVHENIVDVTGELEDYYKHLNCSCIDILQYYNYTLIVDDEGLLKSNNVVIELINKYQPHSLELAGKILVMCINEDNSEELRGLTDKEIHNFISNHKVHLIGITT